MLKLDANLSCLDRYWRTFSSVLPLSFSCTHIKLSTQRTLKNGKKGNKNDEEQRLNQENLTWERYRQLLFLGMRLMELQEICIGINICRRRAVAQDISSNCEMKLVSASTSTHADLASSEKLFLSEVDFPWFRNLRFPMFLWIFRLSSHKEKPLTVLQIPSEQQMTIKFNSDALLCSNFERRQRIRFV